MSTMTSRFTRRSTAILLVASALGLAACGSNSSSSATPAAAPTTSSTSSGSSSNGIPQGNVGDNDSDNHGAPSDGDGNL
jgi:ABC-type glycerol-3-phosphate transport system substrate-binding protein